VSDRPASDRPASDRPAAERSPSDQSAADSAADDPPEIPLFEIAWDERDVANATESIARGGFWAKGPFVTEFEERLEEYVGVDHAVVVNSGTTALVTALRAHGVGPGDEVVVPSFTFVATANAVELVGARPVFADIERETYGLDPASVRDELTDETAALLPVHPYGTTCRIDELAAIADDEDLALVEDAAESLGATCDGQSVGTFGDSAAFSFCQNKVVATGEGGAVLTDDPEIAENARLYRSHGRESSDYFESSASGRYPDVGTNVRMADVVAAIGCAQMEKVDELIDGRRRAADRLSEGLADVAGVEPHRGLPDSTHVRQLYTVTLSPDVDRDAVIDALDARNVSSKIYWDPPVHLTDYYRGRYDYELGALPVTEDVAGRVLSLPIHPNLSLEEADRIVAAVRAGV